MKMYQIISHFSKYKPITQLGIIGAIATIISLIIAIITLAIPNDKKVRKNAYDKGIYNESTIANIDTPKLKLTEFTKDSFIQDQPNNFDKYSIQNATSLNEKDKKTDFGELDIKRNDFKLGFSSSLISIENNTISFSLSNPNNSGLLIVDSIILNVLQVNPYKVCYFPDGPHAVMMPYKFNVKVNPSIKSYLINNDSTFKYAPFEIDKFNVQITSDVKCIYKVRIDIHYYNDRNPDHRFLISSNTHYVPIPEKVNLENYFPEAEKIDNYLNRNESFEALFSPTKHYKYPTSCITRYVFSDEINFPFSDEINFRSMWDYYGNNNSAQVPVNFKFIPDSLFKKPISYIPTYSKYCNQFIVINDSLLFAYIGYGQGQFIDETDIIKKVIKWFNYLYDNHYYNESQQDSLLSNKFKITLH